MELVGRTVRGRPGRVRWIVCALIFLAVVLSYVDRLVLSVLKPTLQHDYRWHETGYADVAFWFQAAYGVGFLAFGRLIDRVGARAVFHLLDPRYAPADTARLAGAPA